MVKKEIIIRNEKDRQELIKRVYAMSLDNPLKFTVSLYRKSRSNAQNRLNWYWLSVIKKHLAETQGDFFTEDELHEWFKAKFLQTKIIEIKEKPVKVIKSTASLKVQDMSDYLNMIDMFCASELNLCLPKPDDYAEAMGANLLRDQAS